MCIQSRNHATYVQEILPTCKQCNLLTRDASLGKHRQGGQGGLAGAWSDPAWFPPVSPELGGAGVVEAVGGWLPGPYMVHGPWSMVNGQWARIHGTLSMVHGQLNQWSVVYGPDPWSRFEHPGSIVHDSPWSWFSEILVFPTFPKLF